MADQDTIRRQVRDYILQEFLKGEPEDSLSNDMRLTKDGILTSIDNIKLVAFLEKTYGIVIEAHEVVGGPLDTVDSITSTVLGKIEAK